MSSAWQPVVHVGTGEQRAEWTPPCCSTKMLFLVILALPVALGLAYRPESDQLPVMPVAARRSERTPPSSLALPDGVCPDFLKSAVPGEALKPAVNGGGAEALWWRALFPKDHLAAVGSSAPGRQR